VVSAWAPPLASVRLLALLSIEMREREGGGRICRLQKYFLPSHGADPLLFDSLLDWLSLLYGPIEQLVLTASREAYQQLLAKMGWRVHSWTGQKLQLCYRRPR
jgi:hypothetical protein